MWSCPRCTEELDDDFDVCWACGTARDGTEDPDFQTADDTPAIRDHVEDSSVVPAPEWDDELAESLPDVVPCFLAENVTEARFVANELRAAGIPAISDKSDLGLNALGGFMPIAWNQGPRVRVRPQDLSAAQVWIETYRLKRVKRQAVDE